MREKRKKWIGRLRRIDRRPDLGDERVVCQDHALELGELPLGRYASWRWLLVKSVGVGRVSAPARIHALENAIGTEIGDGSGSRESH